MGLHTSPRATVWSLLSHSLHLGKFAHLACAALPGVEEGGGVEPLPMKIPQGSNLVAHH